MPTQMNHQHHWRAISKDEINALPLERYSGPVRVISSHEHVAASVAHLRRQTLLGFDTETRPAFRKAQSFDPSLVQFAAEDIVFLFQISVIGLPEEVLGLLSDPAVTKAGIAVNDDIVALQAIAPFEAASFVDLGAMARKAGLKTHGLRNLAANLLGFRVSKGAQRTNWSNPLLSEKQISYAATDAWVSRQLYQRFEQLDLL